MHGEIPSSEKSRMKPIATYIAIVLCLFSLSGYAQKVTITGKVKDKCSGDPIPGVLIRISNDTELTVATGENGYYSIEANPNDELFFSFIGYNTYQTRVEGKLVINVEMDCEDCGLYYLGKAQRYSSHDISVLAAYAFNSWGYGLEYAYLPKIYNTQNTFNKILRFTSLSTRIQKQSSSNGYYKFYPHIKVSTPKLNFPFTNCQKLSFFINAGYYFDTDFRRVSHHDFGLGGGFTAKLASARLCSKYMNINLIGGYTAFLNAEKKDNAYLGLNFYLSQSYTLANPKLK